MHGRCRMGWSTPAQVTNQTDWSNYVVISATAAGAWRRPCDARLIQVTNGYPPTCTRRDGLWRPNTAGVTTRLTARLPVAGARGRVCWESIMVEAIELVAGVCGDGSARVIAEVL